MGDVFVEQTSQYNCDKKNLSDRFSQVLFL